MKKTLLGLLLLLIAIQYSRAQTKVFREVSEEISSQVRVILQDGALVGYMVFTQLEKASEDSFNYKITIMDENLNDIGTVNFREENLNLQAVSFEQDALCLAYFKSNIIGKALGNNRRYRIASRDAKHGVFLQFLNLNGQITRSINFPVEIKTEFTNYRHMINRVLGRLKHDIQLRNLPMKGFACLYGDENNTNLLIYDAAGNQTWKKKITNDALAFSMLTSGQDVYLLTKNKDKMDEGGFEILSYGTSDSTTHPKYTLKDRQGNSLKVLEFDNDAITGKPYVSGTIINPKTGNRYSMVRDIKKGVYTGVFTVNMNGHEKADIKGVYSYWSDASQSFISANGYYPGQGAYARLRRSFRDYQGNTYFAGSEIIKKTKWGAITSSVITIPLFVPPLLILSAGTQKAKTKEVVLLKQTPKGALSLESTIPANDGKYHPGRTLLSGVDNRSFYNVSNSDTKTDYLIVDDSKDISIYNVNQKKIVRTIPHKDGNISTYVYPAKEGHVLVSEYNRKEKYTRFSIESL